MSFLELKRRTKTARRTHQHPCDWTGLPIENGDRYFEVSVLLEEKLCECKGHAIIAEISQKRDGWWSTYASMDLWMWLSGHGLTNDEVDACHQAALDYWEKSRL